jgi:cytochrome c biogenesis factor
MGGPQPAAAPSWNGLFHPPMLYLGFVSFIIPYSFAMGL